MDACQETSIDKIIINLTESLKERVFTLGIPSCAIVIDSIMGELVDIGWPVNIVTAARSRVYDAFIDFCSQNIGMLSLSFVLQQSNLSRKHNAGKTSKLNKNGYVYVAKITEGMVKIGRSKNPNERLKSMQDKGRLKFSETFVSDLIPDCAMVEASIHNLFSEKRRTGEWFDITFDEAVSQVKKLVRATVEGFAEVHGKSLIPAPFKQLPETTE